MLGKKEILYPISRNADHLGCTASKTPWAVQPEDTGQTQNLLSASSGPGPMLSWLPASWQGWSGCRTSCYTVHSPNLPLHPCYTYLPRGRAPWRRQLGQALQIEGGDTRRAKRENGKKTKDTGGPPGSELSPWSLSTWGWQWWYCQSQLHFVPTQASAFCPEMWKQRKLKYFLENPGCFSASQSLQGTCPVHSSLSLWSR